MRKTFSTLGCTSLLVFTLLCFPYWTCKKQEDTLHEAVIELSGVQPGMDVQGTVKLLEQVNGQAEVSGEIRIPSRANQTVSLFITELGNCSDGGIHVGGHFNPNGEAHGRRSGGTGYHIGDGGNITLDASGYAKLFFLAPWHLQPSSRFYVGGRSFVIHGGADDFTTQPDGNPGPQIACGLITVRERR